MDIRLGAVREEDVTFSATGHTHTGGADGENIPTTGIVNSAITLEKLASSRGALVYKSADQAIANITLVLLTWNSETYDTDSIHDNVTNNTRLTVPAGVTQVKLKASIRWQGNATGDRSVLFLKNNLSFRGTNSVVIPGVNASSKGIVLSTPVLDVVAGDYFEMQVYQDSGGSLNIMIDNATYFAMELIK